MFNIEAYNLAQEIIARPENAEALAAYSRCAKLHPGPGDVTAERVLISAIVGELNARLGRVNMAHTIVNECLWAAVS